MAETHENDDTPILRSTAIQFIQLADKSRYRANVSKSSHEMLEKNRNMGVHGNMLAEAYINMLGKNRNMGKIHANMLAKNCNIGHWWRFSEFFNMMPEPLPGAFDVIRAIPKPGTFDNPERRKILPVKKIENMFCLADWESRTHEAYFFESGATFQSDFLQLTERKKSDPILQAAKNIFFLPSCVLSCFYIPD